MEHLFLKKFNPLSQVLNRRKYLSNYKRKVPRDRLQSQENRKKNFQININKKIFSFKKKKMTKNNNNNNN